MTIYCEDCGLPERECICRDEQEALYEENCPNCGAMWGFEEMEREHCFACGYPDTDANMYSLEIDE